MPRHTKLTTFQMEMLIAWFEHHMDASDRQRLMQAMPAAYNAMVGAEVAAVLVRTHEEAYRVAARPEPDEVV